MTRVLELTKFGTLITILSGLYSEFKVGFPILRCWSSLENLDKYWFSYLSSLSHISFINYFLKPALVAGL